MKNLFTLTVFVLMAGSLLSSRHAAAQAPDKMSYQAVIRDAEGNLVAGENIGMKISILHGTVDGTVVYSETRATQTNANGLVTFQIGGEGATAVTGVFAAIDWSAGPWLIRTETDPSGGTDYTITGINQLLSVPFALHAKTAETISEPIVESDPLFEASSAAGIVAGDIGNWDEAYLWGDHAGEGYLTEESDPLFTAWDRSTGIEIAESQISDLKTYYLASNPDGFITAYIVTEEDVTAHESALSISESQITDLQSYLTSITGQSVGDLADIDLTGIEAGKVLKYDAVEEKWIIGYDLGITEETDPLFTEWDKSTGILIVEDQITDLQAYLTELPAGSVPGEMMYWNGSAWVAIEPGQYAQTLSFCNGVPTWGECEASVPVVTTGAVTDITPTSATGGGTVVSQGSASVTSRGIVWSTSPNPTTQTNEGQLSLGSGTGSFSGNMTGLIDGTEYFVRTYAINAEGTAYGNQVSFTTDDQTLFTPTITTNAITDITISSSTSGGSIPDDGGAAVTAKGIVWHNSSMPSVDEGQHLDMTSEGSGNESFVSSITGLQQNTQYYVRAYAINSQGVAYGEQRIFITLQDLDLPTVITAEITDITQTSSKGGGEVTADGGGVVLARGVCWATHESPTLEDHYVESGNGLGVFESNITGLTLGQTYYVRAFATNASGRAYGNQVSFSAMAGLPDVEIISKGTAAGEITIVADVTFDGGAEITDRGVVWDTQDNPTLNENIGSAPEGTGTGEFTSVIEGLTPGTSYYIVAYATNSEGTTYSESVNINFWDFHGTVSDIDGNVYNTVMIGEQEWMAENLKVTAYRNNVTIYNLDDQNDWNNTENGAYVWFDNDISWKDHYGALYNWYAVNDPRGICPTGWSVPSDEDWQEMVNHLGGSSVAGGRLKSTRTEPDPHPRWRSPNTGATNETGFTALPGGSRDTYWYYDIGSSGYWWTSSEQSEIYYISRNSGSIWGSSLSKQFGFSVRCIKD